MTARKTDDELARKIREQRKAGNLTVRGLAKLLGKSASYISLVENGAKVPSERTARRLAQILGDSEELYAAWAAAHKGRDIQTIIESARRYEALQSSPNLRMEVIGPDEVRLEPSSLFDTALRPDAGYVKDSESAADREFVRIPVIPEGVDPGDGPELGGKVLDFLRLDAARIPGEERLVRPFAYRLSQSGVHHVHELLEVGDCVVITRDGEPPVINEVYAVRREGRIILRRVLLKGDALLLLSSRGDESLDFIHLPEGGDLNSLIVGRVAIIIRPLQFSLFSLSRTSGED